jgi:threonine/homoserine/homoserine lactone efflux protein
VVVVAFLIALLPSVGALFIFWMGIRALLEADRRERAAQAGFEARRRPDNPPASQAVPLSRNAGPVTPGEEGSSVRLPPSS